MKEDKMVQSNNAFVRAEQAKMRSKMGGKPSIPAEMKDFCAYMSNDGEHAQEFGRKLTSGMEDAFPVK
jgi:hypothetical protein